MTRVGFLGPHGTFAEEALLTQPAHIDIILRTLLMAVAVTLASAVIAFPVALYMARYAGPRMKALFYVGVMLPMWTSYLVKVYAWRLILAKQGIASWGFEHLGLMGALDKALEIPVVGGPSLASSYIGMFVVFVYMWLPFMILPLAAALERVDALLGIHYFARFYAKSQYVFGALPSLHVADVWSQPPGRVSESE